MASRKNTRGKKQIENRGDNQWQYDREVKLQACVNCGEELMCAKCVADKHKRHQFENISMVTYEKSSNTQEPKKTQLPTITNNLQFIDLQIKENIKHFKSLEKKITLQGERMKDEVDKITKEMIQKCREIEKENYELLSKYRNDIESLFTHLNETTDQRNIRIIDKSRTTDIEKDTQQELKTQNFLKCRTVEFKAGPKLSKHIQDDFGSLSVRELQMLVPQLPRHDVVKHYSSCNSSCVSEFVYSTNVSSIEKSTTETVWISYHRDKSVSLVTLQGEVKQKLELGSIVEDISVSPATGNLWLCCSDKAVYEASGDEVAKRFTTESLPLCLCMTPDNNVVVGTSDHNVTVYSTTGRVLHSAQGSGSVVFPRHVTVCTRTGDIAVCDDDLLGVGGKGKPHVSVFNSKLNLKYWYYGPPASVMETDFSPSDVVYDIQGRLLIGEYNNKCIQLVSGEGEFLTVVHTDTLQPWALTLIQDGVLCVSFVNKKNIKVIRYKV